MINHDWMANAIESMHLRAINNSYEAGTNLLDNPDYSAGWDLFESRFMSPEDLDAMLMPPHEDDPRWYH